MRVGAILMDIGLPSLSVSTSKGRLRNPSVSDDIIDEIILRTHFLIFYLDPTLHFISVVFIFRSVKTSFVVLKERIFPSVGY